jgi:hypothetical protein
VYVCVCVCVRVCGGSASDAHSVLAQVPIEHLDGDLGACVPNPDLLVSEDTRLLDCGLFTRTTRRLQRVASTDSVRKDWSTLELGDEELQRRIPTRGNGFN